MQLEEKIAIFIGITANRTISYTNRSTSNIDESIHKFVVVVVIELISYFFSL